jgi:putative membrane protein
MTYMLPRCRLTVAVTAVVLVAGCSRADRAEVDTAVSRAGEVVAAAADTIAGRLGGREYSNAELVGFVNAYNDAEIEIGEMAQTKATDPQVREFARRILTDHRALKTEATSTAQRLSLTPTVPASDDNLRADHQAGMRDLSAKAKGREFDEAFVEHEIKMHKKVLDDVEDAIARNRNQEIRPLLEKARDGLRTHLRTAEELEKKFGN